MIPATRQAAERLLVKQQDPKTYLDMFWAAAETAKPGKRLGLLRAMGGIQPARSWTKPEKRHKEMRKHFTFALVDFSPEDRCFVCSGDWHHRHHIINIQYDGGNSRRNLVPLCRACHQAVHGRCF